MHGAVDRLTIRHTTDYDRITLRIAEGANASASAAGARDLDDGDRAGILARLPGFMHKECRMCLQEPACTELDDARTHAKVLTPSAQVASIFLLC